MTATPETAAPEGASTIDLDRLYTAEELSALSVENVHRYELKKGKLTMMSPAGSEHGKIAMRLSIRLGVFIEEHDLGTLFAAETGFKLAENPDTVLAPDTSFVSKARMPHYPPRGYFPGAPDLAVEVVSPHDRAPDVQDKVQEWLRHGALLVWVVEPKTRTVTVYRPDGSATVLQVTDTLTGETVLPGFEYALSRLFE